MAEQQQYQHSYTQFYVEKVQSGVLTTDDLQSYNLGVQNGIKKFGDDTGRDTMIHQSINEALATLQSQQQ
jgi:hypothetical protein